VVSSLQVFHLKHCTHFSPLPCELHDPAHLILFDLVTLITFNEAYNLWNTSLCSPLQPPATFAFLGPNVLLSTLFSSTLNLCKKSNFTYIQQRWINLKAKEIWNTCAPSWSIPTPFQTLLCMVERSDPTLCVRWTRKHRASIFGKYYCNIRMEGLWKTMKSCWCLGKTRTYPKAQFVHTLFRLV
jgi:hypothetical protein